MEIVKKHHPDRAGADNAESKAIFEVRNSTKGFDNSLNVSKFQKEIILFSILPKKTSIL
jgi:hypothetical protein